MRVVFYPFLLPLGTEHFIKGTGKELTLRSMPEERSTGTIDGDRALNRSTVWKTIPRSVTSDVDSPLRRDLLGTDLLGTEHFIKVPYALSLSRSSQSVLRQSLSRSSVKQDA